MKKSNYNPSNYSVYESVFVTKARQSQASPTHENTKSALSVYNKSSLRKAANRLGSFLVAL